MKRLTQAATLFVSAITLSSSALAHVLMKDDVSSRYNWTGYYAGLNAGAVNNTMNITDNQATTFNATIRQTSDPAFTGGVQVGYRRQIDFSNVSGLYGLEFSANSSNARFTQTYGSAFALYKLRTENELNNFCMLELIGGIAADRTLLFLAAGLSWTNITGSIINASGIPFFNSVNLDNKALGTALGAGIEYAFTDTISVRFKVDVLSPNSYTASDGLGDQFNVSDNVVLATVGVNYKFA